MWACPLGDKLTNNLVVVIRWTLSTLASQIRSNEMNLHAPTYILIYDGF